ncbi:MAG: hypothetical protein RR263_04960, partial [Oscillospiraceae bacterium]
MFNISTLISCYPYTMEQLLRTATEKDSSDLHLVVGMPPLFRISSQLMPYDAPPLKPEDIQKILFDLLEPEQIDFLKLNWELDFSYAIPGCARFRGNVIVQRGTLAVVF